MFLDDVECAGLSPPNKAGRRCMIDDRQSLYALVADMSRELKDQDATVGRGTLEEAPPSQSYASKVAAKSRKRNKKAGPAAKGEKSYCTVCKRASRGRAREAGAPKEVPVAPQAGACAFGLPEVASEGDPQSTGRPTHKASGLLRSKKLCEKLSSCG